MRLKRLEIYGFKSFAERTVMVFDDGITGVVGPNGSGKSNISDAVRWVLGEQSAKTLRGAKMEDIIFGGTLKRRALNYCEVSLVFDNEDGTLPVEFSEVLVTRRVYRSGESEYSLNKAACRLKDIVDLFRDTGIGKEGYSLIGQGRVDEILSTKSEDRRNVFEEAAGITKFKARRTEAERRMEHTAQNLDRVEDILGEVGQKLPQLEEQAKAARSYTQLMQELRVLEANIFLARHSQLSKEIDQSQGQIQDHEESIAAMEEERSRLLAQASLEEDEAASLDKQLTALNEELVEFTRAFQIHEGETGVLKERIESAQTELKRLQSEEENAQLNAEEIATQMNREDRAIAALQEEEQELSARYLSTEEQVQKKEKDVEALEEEGELAKQRMIASFSRLTDVKSVTARLTATRESLQGQLSSVQGSKSGQEEALDNVRNAVKQAQAQVEQAALFIDEHKKQAALLAGQHAALLLQLAQEEQNAARINGAYREAQSRLKMLEQMKKEYEGYQNSVREVLKRFAGESFVHGVVASLATVPRELEKAVEMALGGSMQNIVCEREEDAKRMIDLLRENRLGRATFLPLSAVRGRVLSEQEREVLSMPGCVGVASELIGYDTKYKNVFENLLGRTVIAQDLGCGIAIMRKGRHAFRLVTLEGDMMHSGGSMTGGSTQSRTTSLLSREREISEYRQANKKLEDRSAQNAALLLELKQKQGALGESLKEANAQIHEDDLSALLANSNLEAARQAYDRAKGELETYALEKERLLDSIKEIDAELQAIGTQAGEAEDLSSSTQAGIAAINERIRKMRDELEDLRNELSKTAAEQAGVKARLETAIRDKERGEHSAQQLGQAGLIRQRAKTGLLARVEGDQKSLAESEQRAALAQKQLEGKREELGSAQGMRQARQQSLRAATDRGQRLVDELQTQRDRLHRLELRLEKSKEELRQITDRLWERHELSYALAEELRAESFDPPKARERSEEIRAVIRQMGMVNLAAVQEYEESKDRFESLNRQKQDLEKAQKDLTRIIRDLTSEMETLFISRFQEINERFSKTFQKLFEGGTALLRLQDDSDCLNCGIDIVAQPPGKKLQLLSLLSGGERALTAIALLFSMLTIRPSPFCILDEIEAALDEVNVESFAKYLEEYARGTQFIVITHRKGTMEHCNALYGVAMEEKGVSRMVSVQLSDIDQQEMEGTA